MTVESGLYCRKGTDDGREWTTLLPQRNRRRSSFCHQFRIKGKPVYFPQSLHELLSPPNNTNSNLMLYIHFPCNCPLEVNSLSLLVQLILTHGMKKLIEKVLNVSLFQTVNPQLSTVKVCPSTGHEGT